ncbi:MAG TPA: hypothetical protein VFE47_24040 [Tepidisphaeraceae bacterium]|jgi:hypothetical protein|nr:hypothetical protein [Tepidisphaeraceae bacterium]
MMTTDITPQPNQEVGDIVAAEPTPATANPPTPPPLPVATVQVNAPIPYATLATAGDSTPPQAFAQQAAIFSIAAWLFCIAASVGMSMRGVHPPAAFSLVLLFGLFIGLALGIAGIFCSGKPRQVAILVPGIIGIVLNGLLLLVIIVATLGVVARAQQSSTAAAPTVYVPQTPYISPPRPFRAPQPRPFRHY